MKPWWKSRTVWANVITCLVALLMFAGSDPLFEPYARHLLFASGALNIVLRFITGRPIRTPDPPG